MPRTQRTQCLRDPIRPFAKLCFEHRPVRVRDELNANIVHVAADMPRKRDQPGEEQRPLIVAEIHLDRFAAHQRSADQQPDSTGGDVARGRIDTNQRRACAGKAAQRTRLSDVAALLLAKIGRGVKRVVAHAFGDLDEIDRRQPSFGGGSRSAPRLELGGVALGDDVEATAILSGAFRFVHQRVGAREKFVNARSARPLDRDRADRARQTPLESRPAQVELARPFADRLPKRTRLGRGRTTQDDHEFLAAVTSDDRFVPGHVAQRQGERLEQIVAALVTVCVVDRLEVVEVGEEDADCGAGVALLFDRDGGRLDKPPAVEHACQGIQRGAFAILLQRILETALLVADFAMLGACVQQTAVGLFDDANELCVRLGEHIGHVDVAGQVILEERRRPAVRFTGLADDFFPVPVADAELLRAVAFQIALRFDDVRVRPKMKCADVVRDC